jgi:hypothetical protein
MDIEANIIALLIIPDIKAYHLIKIIIKAHKNQKVKLVDILHLYLLNEI